MFAHRLALALGGMTVREMRCRMSCREFVRWQAFYIMEGFGEERADERAGVIAATITNNNPWRRSHRVMQPEDYMLHAVERHPERTAEEWKLRLNQMFIAAMAAQDRK